MKIKSKDFRVRRGEKVKLNEWPTIVKPYFKSKKRYQNLLDEHVEELSSLQRLLYASNRYALLLIFQGMDSAGKDGAIRPEPEVSRPPAVTRACTCELKRNSALKVCRTAITPTSAP